MSMKSVMREKRPVKRATTAINEKLYRENKDYRSDLLVEKWSRAPEIGKGIANMDSRTARNLAILLENQTNYMSKMTEAQLSSNFAGQTPENMLRLIRLTYPNSIRKDLFTEMSLETVNDSIKYIYPIYTNASRDSFDWDLEQPEYDMNNRFDNDYDGRPMYESTESRYATELVNVAADNVEYTSGTLKVTFKGEGALANFIEKDATIYILDYDPKTEKTSRKALAVATNDGWMISGGVTLSDGSVIKVNADASEVFDEENGVFEAPIKVVSGEVGLDKTSFAAVARYDSEKDLTGKYLGEVELQMRTYHFRPRPIVLGLTWTQFTEITLESSFGVSAEDLLTDSASQEIKKTLDYQAVKYARDIQKLHAPENFEAFDASAGDKSDDSYWHTAQIVNQAIGHISDNMFDAFGRGGVSAIVGGSRFCRYLELNEGWSSKGAQTMIGGHKVGELNGTPVFAVPSDIVPANEAITTWKNDAVEGDVSIVIGTFLSFFNTGSIQRKHLYKESALARYEDTQALQPKYLGRVQIQNIR